MKKNMNEKVIRKSNITLLIISLIFLFISIFIGKGMGDFVPTELCSILVLYYSIVSIFVKNNKKLIYKLGIIESIIMILFIVLDKSVFVLIYFLLGIIFLVENIMYNIYLNSNKYKDSSKLKSFILIIIPFLISGILFIHSEIQSRNIINNLDVINSKKELIDSVDIVEDSINSNITNSVNARDLEIKFKQKNVNTTSLISLDILKNNNYKCTAYTNLTWNEYSDESYYNYIINIDEYEDKDSIEYYKHNEIGLDNFYTGKTYISCKGKYNYQTNGFNENLLK